nr:hypothetical protein GCM10020092_039640 [Actinoplanes digitatis]
MRRAEERLGDRRAPVDEQPAARAVGEAAPPDVHRLGFVRTDHAAQAQVGAEAPQIPKAGGQPEDLLVPVQRPLPGAAGRPACGVEAVGQLGGQLIEALGDGREVLLVAGDQGQLGLGGQALGKVEHAGAQAAAHGVNLFHFRRLWPWPAILRYDPGLAASPRVRYTLEVEESVLPYPAVGCSVTFWRYSASPRVSISWSWVSR